MWEWLLILLTNIFKGCIIQMILLYLESIFSVIYCLKGCTSCDEEDTDMRSTFFTKQQNPKWRCITFCLTLWARVMYRQWDKSKMGFFPGTKCRSLSEWTGCFHQTVCVFYFGKTTPMTTINCFRPSLCKYYDTLLLLCSSFAFVLMGRICSSFLLWCPLLYPVSVSNLTTTFS